jgi:hypothetical protein
MFYAVLAFVAGIYVGQEYPIYSVKDAVNGLFIKKQQQQQEFNFYKYILEALNKKSK